MKRWSWKRFLVITPVAIMLLASAAYLGLHILVGLLCVNETVREYPSPDGKLKAVLYRRSCGATTGWSRQVAILPWWQSVRRWSWPGPVCATEDYITIQPTWIDATHLKVVYGPMGHSAPGWIEGGPDRLIDTSGSVKISYHYVP